MSAEQTDQLAAMIADLQSHIEQRAHEIAEPRITEAHEASQQAVDNVMATAAATEQRLNDLVAELRRQLNAQVRRAEQAEARLREVAQVKVWKNEDGQRFVFVEDLAPVVLPKVSGGAS